MERMSSLEMKNGSPASSSVSVSNLAPSTAAELGLASSQGITPVPAMALAPTTSELALAPSNCPNCKLLNRHLRVSREWNNFFRLKLDQRDMLLHVAADYKRQKQRCLQLQMSLDQQSRECGEMREQLTTLLLDVNPLRDRLQIAEQHAEEEMKRREKAESEEYNLRFVVEQQKHKIQSFEKKFKSSLVETLERKLSCLRTDLKRIRQEGIGKSRIEWEMKEAVSFARALELRALKKAYWGLSLAHKYGSHLLNQDQLPEGESSQEWSCLKNMLEKVETNLHQHYLALCRRVSVRPLKEVWLNDFHEEDWQEGESGAEDSGAKQLERLIQDDGDEKLSEEEIEQEELKNKEQKEKTEQKFAQKESQQSYTGSYISRCKETVSFEHEPGNNVSSSKDQGKVVTTSILDTSTDDIDSDPFPRLQNGVEEAAPHTIDTGIRKKTRKVIKSTSILDTSIEDSDEEPLARSQACMNETATHSLDVEMKGAEELSRSTATLDTSMIDDPSDSHACKGAPPVTSYHFDEELKAILQKMRPHEKLESMDTFFSEEPNPLIEPDMCSSDMKQNFLGSLSDSEEEEEEKEKKNESEMHRQEAEDGDEVETCLVPRILTTQISEGFSVIRSHKDNSLLDDLDISTDTFDPEGEDEKEEEKDIQKRVPLPHFQSSQSFSFDVEECHPLPSSVENHILMSEEGGISEGQLTLSQCQLPQSVDKDGNNTHGLQTDIPRSQNKGLLKELRHMFGAVDDTTSFCERGTVDADQQVAGRTVENNFLGMAEEAIHTEVCQVHQEYPNIPVAEDMLIKGGIFVKDSLEKDVINGAKSIAVQEEKSQEEEERSTKVKGEECGSVMEEKTAEATEKRTIGAEKKRTIKAVKDKTTENVEATPTEREEQATEAEEGRAIKVQEERTTKAVEERSTEVEEDRTIVPVVKRNTEAREEKTAQVEKERTTQAEEERITEPHGDRVSKAEEERNIEGNEVRNTEINKQRTTEAEQKRDTEHEKERPTETEEEKTIGGEEERTTEHEEEKNTEAEEERMTEIEEERTTGTEEERSTETEEERTAGTEEERTTGTEKERTTGTEEDRTTGTEEERTTGTEKERTTVTEEERSTGTEEERTTGTEEDRTTGTEEERTTGTEEERTTGTEEDRTTGTEEDRTTGTEKERTTGTEEERSTETEEERTTGTEEERTTGTEEERTTGTEEERTTGTEEDRTTGTEEEGTTGTEKERTTGTEEDRTTGTEEERTTGTEQERTTEPEEEKATKVGERTTEAKEKRSEEVEDGRTTMAEEERNALKSEDRSSPVRQRRKRMSIVDMLKLEGNQEEEDEADEWMEGGHWERRLRKKRKNYCELEEETKNGKGSKSRQCVQRQQHLELEKVQLEEEKKKRKKIENVEKIEENRIQDEEQKKRKKEEKRKEQKEEKGINLSREEEESRREESERERMQEERIKQENEKKGRKQEKEMNKEKGERKQENEKKSKEDEERKRKKSEVRKRNEEKEEQVKQKEEDGRKKIEKKKVQEEEETQEKEKNKKQEKIMKQEIREKEKKEKGKERRIQEEEGETMKQEEKKMKKEKQRKKRNQEERERKIQEEEGERQEQKKRKQEKDELYNNEEEEQYRLEFKQMEKKKGEKEMEQEEDQKKVSEINKSSMGEHDTTESQKGVIGRRHVVDTSKRQEKIVFSWGLKRKQWRKPIKFNKQSRFTRVFPDPLGSRQHSVFTMECRIHNSEQEQVNKKGTKDEQSGSGPSLRTPEVQIRCDKEREEGKENNVGKTKKSVIEEIPAGIINKQSREPKIKENKRKHLGEEETYINEKAVKMENRRRVRTMRRRRRNSSSSSSSNSSSSNNNNNNKGNFSGKRETVCIFPGELSSRGKTPQQSVDLKKNATLIGCSRKSNPSKARTSKVALFGSDSDSSGTSEEERKKQVNKSRKDEEEKQPGMIHHKNKSFRSSLLVAVKVGGKKKSTEQVQIRRTKGPASSYSLLSTSQTTNSEELLDQRIRQNSLGQGTESITSDSDIPDPFANRKWRTKVMESKSKNPEENMKSAVYLRKRRRNRRVDDSTESQESNTSDDGHHSPTEQRQHLASLCSTANLHNTCRMIQNKIQTEKDEKLSIGTYLTPSTSTPAVTPHALKQKLSEVLPVPQGKHLSVTEERGCQTVPGRCRKQSFLPPKQQNKIKSSVLQGDLGPQPTPEPPSSYHSMCQRGERVGCGQQGQIRIDRTLEQDSTAQQIMTTPSLTSDRKHMTLFLENPPHSSKRMKGNSVSWDRASRQHKEQKMKGFSDTSVNISEGDRVDGHKDTPVLSQMNSEVHLLPQGCDDALVMSQSESDMQVLLEGNDQEKTDALEQSKSESEGELVIEENPSNCINASMLDTPDSNESTTQTQVAAVNRSQKGQVLRTSRLGPVAFIDRPRFIQKSAPTPKLTTIKTPIPAGPEYIDKLFSKLNQWTERSSLDSAQDSHVTQPQGASNSQTGGNNIPKQPYLNQHAWGIDYQGQSPVLLPNIYGTLRAAPAIEKSEPSPSINSSQCEPNHPLKTSHAVLPSSGYVSSTTELTQPCPILDQPHPIPDEPHITSGTSCLTVVESHSIHSQHPQCPATSYLPEFHLQQIPWLPEIIPEQVIHHGKQQKERNVPLASEDLEETLEEVVASRIQSKWWVMGLGQICASITTTTLPCFLRFVLKSILRSNPLEPRQHHDGLPPRLYRLFQVVCVVEQRLAPQHPHSLRNALLRAAQAIITKPDINLTPYSLASLTAWYIASASIEGQTKAGQEWVRARTFLVDLLFHHPGTIHLALLTAANTSRRLFYRFMQRRVASGLELVIVWLAHYGLWVGQPGVRSDLTKWLAQHLSLKKPPQSPAILAKSLVTLLAPGKNKDWQWGAAAGLVVLVRWQGRPWARKHLLPALLTAIDKTTTNASQQEQNNSSRRDLQLHEDLKTKISHIFDKLGRALPHGLEKKDSGDVVKEIEDAVTSLFCLPIV